MNNETFGKCAIPLDMASVTGVQLLGLHALNAVQTLSVFNKYIKCVWIIERDGNISPKRTVCDCFQLVKWCTELLVWETTRIYISVRTKTNTSLHSVRPLLQCSGESIRSDIYKNVYILFVIKCDSKGKFQKKTYMFIITAKVMIYVHFFVSYFYWRKSNHNCGQKVGFLFSEVSKNWMTRCLC